MTDQWASFISHQFREFAASLRIKLMNSSPYYAQSNGQAEANNKIIIGLIKKKIEEKTRRWHEVLDKSLWAYRTSKHGTIQVTSFEQVYGQEAVLPVELNLQVNWVVKQDTLSSEEYKSSMMDEVDDLLEKRLQASREIEKNKVKIAKAYNKRVQEKSFQIDDMVWKMILPLGSRDNKFGKWSPSVRLKLWGSCWARLTLLRPWKGGCYLKLLMGSTFKSIILASGRGLELKFGVTGLRKNQ
jgi:hypothetical protein